MLPGVGRWEWVVGSGSPGVGRWVAGGGSPGVLVVGHESLASEPSKTDIQTDKHTEQFETKAFTSDAPSRSASL